ncbi:HNH endonuclease signature motif containing protein [Microbacterium tumbae]
MLVVQEISAPREEELLEVFEGLNAELAALEARRVRVLAERFDLLLDDDPFLSPHHDIAVRALVAELAATAHLSHTAMETAMCRAHILVHSYPRALRALEDGVITLRHAEVIIQAGSALDSASEAERAEYEGRVLEHAVCETPGRTESIAKLIAAEVAPTTVADRHRCARERRGVRARSLDDGMGELVITAAELHVRAAYDRATEVARQIIAQRPAVGPSEKDADTGKADVRTLEQVRSDVVMELLLAAPVGSVEGTPAERITATVQVTIAAAALAGADDRMAEFDGFGPVLSEDARMLAGFATTWERLFVAGDGMVVATDAYTPTANMRRYLRARDQRCRFPGCRRPARRCQIDHNHDHAKGGKTEICNLSCFCTGHHTLKHPDLLDRHRWSVRQLPGGVIAWISPAGHTYIDEPPRRVAFV